jgi:hypothetical protein
MDGLQNLSQVSPRWQSSHYPPSPPTTTYIFYIENPTEIYRVVRQGGAFTAGRRIAGRRAHHRLRGAPTRLYLPSRQRKQLRLLKVLGNLV